VAYAPADGRLAAAIATISASRRPIRDRVSRSNERSCRMLQVLSAPADNRSDKERKPEIMARHGHGRECVENSNAFISHPGSAEHLLPTSIARRSISSLRDPGLAIYRRPSRYAGVNPKFRSKRLA
jgi:hypothetical protein